MSDEYALTPPELTDRELLVMLVDLAFTAGHYLLDGRVSFNSKQLGGALVRLIQDEIKPHLNGEEIDEHCDVCGTNLSDAMVCCTSDTHRAHLNATELEALDDRLQNAWREVTGEDED